MSARIVITCDDCGAVGPEPGKTHRSARRHLSPKGWTNRRAGVDHCGACTEKRKAVIPEEHRGYF